MSTKNLELYKGGKESATLGNTYDGDVIYRVNPNLNESYTSKYFTPTNGSCGTVHTLVVDLGVSDEFNVNTWLLEFKHNNLDGTLSQTVINPYLLIGEFKVLLNQQEVIYHSSQEEIFLAFADYFKEFSKDQQTSFMASIMPVNQSNPLAGETLSAGGTLIWSLPLTPLAKSLNNISRSDGASRITFEFKFIPNYATTSANCRFMQSSTTNNPYTTSTISFTEIAMRLITTKHSDQILRNVPNSIMLLRKYDVKTYQLSFNANSVQQRVQLSQDFSLRNIVYGVYVYIYDYTRITAYNDADSMKIFSGSDVIGWELKFKSKTIHKYDAVLDKGKRNKYYFDTYRNSNGRLIPSNLIQQNDNVTQYFVPLTFIDLANVHDGLLNSETVSGLPSNSDLELIITNAVSGGTFSTSCFLNVALCYYERCKLDPKSGVLTYYK